MGQADQGEQRDNPITTVRRSENELVVTRSFDAPARVVFEAWTRADLFRQWWAPKSMGAVISACEINAHTGGGYRITFGDGPDAPTFFGQYLEVQPASRLVWTNEEGGQTQVTTVTFEDQGERTLLTLTERYEAPPHDEAAEQMQRMMAEQFAQLDELLAAPHP